LFEYVFVCVRLVRHFFYCLSVENGEACFESIEIDDKQVPKSQITVSSGATKRKRTHTNSIRWIHDATDPTPWILVCIIHAQAKTKMPR
jgi:hypothetical protein